MKIFHRTSALLNKRLSKFEKMGRYDDAFSEIQEIWTDRDQLPNVKDFDARTAAEIILRCGSLIGFLGQYKQLPNAQEKSKNLLTEARNRFLDIYDVEKIAECENFMALAYWRSGELSEAEDWLTEAFTHSLPESNLIRLHSVIIRSMILLSAKKYQEILEYLNDLEALFLKFADNSLIGSFYNNLGIVLECLGKVSLALTNLEKAKNYHYKSGNKFEYAYAENNLSMLYKAQRNFIEAHKSSDNAVAMFKKIKDRTHEGVSLDTKAQIYFDEGKFDKALESADRSIETLKFCENTLFVTESYLTKTKTLICLNNISDATVCLFKAVELAKVKTGEKAAERLIREYEITLREKFEDSSAIVGREPKSTDQLSHDPILADQNNNDLEFILPPSIANFKEIQVVQIRNRHLEYAGLEKDSLAVVANIKVEKGDLAAVMDSETNAVNCGFYDEDFGIICLESRSPDPILFDKKNVEILGKIIGVGKQNKTFGNKISVKSLLE